MCDLKMDVQELQFISRNLGKVTGRAVVRVDLNLPVHNGKISSNNLRLKTCAKHLEEYVDNGIMPIIVSHQGRRGDSDYLESLEQHAVALEAFVDGLHVVYANGFDGEDMRKKAEQLRQGEALLLKNVRDHEDEKKQFSSVEELSSCGLVRELASLANFYINDAPATMHRNDASLVGPVYAMPSYLGLQMEEELKIMQEMRNKIRMGEKTAIIFGGKKWEKFEYIYKIARHRNVRLLCGGMPGQALCYAKNKEAFNRENAERIEKSESLETAKKLLAEFGDRITYPSDFILDTREDIGLEGLSRAKGLAMDIGEETLNSFFEAIEGADAVIYAGPVGVYELGYNQTLRLITRFMGLKCDDYTLGGNSSDSMDNVGLEKAYELLGGKRMTSGGSALAYLADEKLPVLEVFKSVAQNAKARQLSSKTNL